MGYYLFAILPNINVTISIFLAVTSFFMALWFAGFIVTLDDCDGDLHKSFSKLGKWFVPFYIVLILLQTFVPSQKQLAFIIAAPYIVENQDLKDIGKNSTEIIKLGTEYVKDVLTTATAKKGE